MIIAPFVLSSILLVISLTNKILLAIILFVIYNCIFEFLVPISCYQIAHQMQKMKKTKFGTVFSFNAFLSMAVQTIIQVIIQSLKFDIRNHFRFFSYSMFFLSVSFVLLKVIQTICKKKKVINI